eukprot:scaffold7454_cov77-Cyclotella_meneghiniana.AAC.14
MPDPDVKKAGSTSTKDDRIRRLCYMCERRTDYFCFGRRQFLCNVPPKMTEKQQKYFTVDTPVLDKKGGLTTEGDGT